MIRFVAGLLLATYVVNAIQIPLTDRDDSVIFPQVTYHKIKGQVVDDILNSVVRYNNSLVGITNVRTDETKYGKLVSHYSQVAILGECPRHCEDQHGCWISPPCTSETADNVAKYGVYARKYRGKLVIKDIKRV